MSAGDTPERTYRCQHEGCDGILAVSAVRHGVIKGVCCPVCHRAQSVYLGGYRPPVATRREADPGRPPIEAGPVRPWRRR